MILDKPTETIELAPPHDSAEKTVPEGNAAPSTQAALKMGETIDRTLELEYEQKNQLLVEQEKYNDLLDYYTLWVHQVKTPIAASSLLIGDLKDKEAKSQLKIGRAHV